ncbi:MAG: hypothetical protein ABFS56_26530 [Pseudomonadota bacterium]
MSDMIFVRNEKLTELYQRNFGEFGIIGYHRIPYEPEPIEKYYYLFLKKSQKRFLLGKTVTSVSIRLEDMYIHKRFWKFLKPYPTLAELEREIKALSSKRGQKRRDLIKQISMIETWERGVFAKIATNLGRTVSAVRQMCAVLTKKGLLVRVRRGVYSVA